MADHVVKIDGYCTVGLDREFNLTEEALLRAMDEAQVYRAVIAPPDRFLAVYNREGNEAMRKAAKSSRGRLIPSCTANPWFGELALEELHRATEEGARILVLHPFVQGFLADDELAYPILEEAQRQKLPLYIHTGPPGNATPWHAAALALRFSELDIIMGHSGATDFAVDVPWATSASENIYIEASFARPFSFCLHLEKLGAGRGIMGSGAPINDLVFEWAQMRHFASTGMWPQIAGANLQRLLEKRGSL